MYRIVQNCSNGLNKRFFHLIFIDFVPDLVTLYHIVTFIFDEFLTSREWKNSLPSVMDSRLFLLFIEL